MDELQTAGADLIVYLDHLGVDDESEGMCSSDVITAVDGIDVFIDGHSHIVIAGDVIQKGEGYDAAETLLVQSGSYGQNLGVVIFDGETLTSGLIPAAQYDSTVLPLTGLLPKHEDEGDTYGVFAYSYQQTGYDTYKALEDALVDYVTEVFGGAIAAPYDAPQGRITIHQ